MVGANGTNESATAYDEAFHGTAADSYYEIQVQTDRRTPLPDDRWKRGPRSGRRA
ncbi:hypothetical protein [Streptomyces sviceus]|uniref:hypothetical protein n=1 Tax=Streptomyces sviceus TaxID=285530 RepID=UPI0036EB5EA1